MGIISSANMVIYTDHIGAIWDWLRVRGGSSVNLGSAAKGTTHWFAEQMKDLIVSDVDDFDQETDLLSGVGKATENMVVQKLTGGLTDALRGLNQHCTLRGSGTSSTITNFATYLTYLNSTPFTVLVTPGFRDAWANSGLPTLPQGAVMKRTNHPLWDPDAVGTDGMGTVTFDDTFVDGVAIDVTKYAETNPIAEVVTNFTGGAGAPTVNVSGTDHSGNAITWNGTFASTDPLTTGVSTTITPAVTQFTRSTVAVGSATGIVDGSILTVNSGLVDEEVILVETVSGSDITAVFLKAHGAGATLTGPEYVALTPSVAGQRLRDVTGATMTISSHSAGKVRILNTQERSSI